MKLAPKSLGLGDNIHFMAKIIDFPNKKSHLLSNESSDLIRTIQSRIIDELEHPEFRLEANFNDPVLAQSLTDSVTIHNGKWSDILMKANLIAIEETIRSGIKEFK